LGANYGTRIVSLVVTITLVIVFFELVPEKTIWSIPIKAEEEHMLAAPGSGGYSVVLMQNQEEHKAATKEQEYKKQNHGGRRILIVDGNQDVAFTFKITLENCGFKERVDAYDDPVLAIVNFRPQFYSLAILHINMPKMNGFQLFNILKKLDNDLKFLFCSAFENTEEFTRLYQSQIESDIDTAAILRDMGDCFIKKPVDVDYLVRRVRAEIQ
jgi:CheY-like chemotaxis protein